MKTLNWVLSAFAVATLALQPGISAAGDIDTDGDGVADTSDNCSLIANPDQRDTNGDGFGNRCDPDLNNDLIVNPIDLGLFRAAFFDTGPGLDADFNGDDVVNPIDLGILRSFFFGPPGPGATTSSVTYTDDVQPILGVKCAPCHTGLGAGGHNVGTVYDDALLSANDNDCDGLVIGECALVLIQNGSMPQGAGCTGDPAQDAGNDACLTQAEQDTLQAWIDAGLPE
jgi:hypothetical protein